VTFVCHELHSSEYAHMCWFNVCFTRGSVNVGTLALWVAFYIRYIKEDVALLPAVPCYTRIFDK